MSVRTGAKGEMGLGVLRCGMRSGVGAGSSGGRGRAARCGVSPECRSGHGLGRSTGRASGAEPGRGDKEVATSFKNWMDTHFDLLQSWQDVFMDKQTEALNKCISDIEVQLAKFNLTSPPDMAQTVKTVGIDCAKVDVLYK